METPRFFTASITSPAKAIFVGQGITLIVNAAVDHAAEMLGKITEDVWIHFANRPIDVDFNARRQVVAARSKREPAEIASSETSERL